MSDNILYQHGTLALLVPGLLDGTITLKELLTHGDTGIGTGEGLDGELIILNGVAYQVDHTGTVNIVKDDFTLPFANVHHANFSKLTTFEDVTQEQFHDKVLQLTNSQNTFFSVKITGTFKDVKTRAVKKSNKPYDTLAKTAEDQSIFNRKEVKGTLITYYSPQIFDGASVGGYHDHFLDDDHTFGGHILGFGTVSGEVEFQQFDTLEQHLPTQNKDYMKHDFSNDNILEAIHQAEN